jgi:hypothetical protein
MALTAFHKISLTAVFTLCICGFTTAQIDSITVVKDSSFIKRYQPTITISQDERISKLLQLKKKLNKQEGVANIYKIQLYSGSRSVAENTVRNFQKDFPNIVWAIKYESPDNKVQVGNFRTSMEADRYLIEIRKKYPAAFKFQPNKR